MKYELSIFNKKMRIALVLMLYWGGCFMGFSQSTTENLPKQDPDSVKEELRALFVELSIKHPGFYRYNDKDKFDAFIDSTIQTIDAPINEIEILRKAKPIVAKIGCLHSGIHLSEETENLLNQSANCLPFTLFYDKGKAFIWKTFEEQSPLSIGDEVVSINGQAIGAIYEKLLKSIPMDGYNQSGKFQLLRYTFPEAYRSIIEVTEGFEIVLSNGQKHKLKGVKMENTLQYSDIVNQGMSLEIIDDIAIIKIPSFANSFLRSHGQNFQKEIKSYIKNIQSQNIRKILIDLRGNTGGSDSNPAWLSSYFFDKPFRYWDRIEITEPIAKEIKGLNRLFYGKPQNENGKWLWSDKGLSSKEFKFTRVQEAAKNPFTGSTYILTDGMCMSSCSDFVAIMQSNGKAIVFGEETGGGYQGNTSGLIPSQALSCGLVVDVPLLKYVNHVEKGKNVGRGSMPDIEVRSDLEVLLNEEKFMKELIKAIKELE
ncbi:MAG: S41 family peptidase [Bacteroidia bacterium]|nr:S41 family peptidase [Bacteroidia bacterium]